MKRVKHYDTKETLHVETPLGIVNIRVGLTSEDGRAVDSIEIIPSGDNGQLIRLEGCGVNRLVEVRLNRSLRKGDPL